MSKESNKVTLLSAKKDVPMNQCFENTAFYWGKSVFTTGLISKDGLAFFSAHEQRLEKAFNWLFNREDHPCFEQVLSPLKNSTLTDLGSDEYLKLRVTYFENMKGEFEHLLEVSPYEKNVALEVEAETMSCPSLSLSRPSFVKLGSYAETIRLRRMSKNEPLFIDPEDHIMEGAVANIIFFDPELKKWVTPKSKFTIVEGLGLKIGLEELNIESVFIKRESIQNYRAAFFVNCLKGVMPISSIDGFNLEDNKLYSEELQRVFDKKCRETSRQLWQMEK